MGATTTLATRTTIPNVELPAIPVTVPNIPPPSIPSTSNSYAAATAAPINDSSLRRIEPYGSSSPSPTPAQQFYRPPHARARSNNGEATTNFTTTTVKISTNATNATQNTNATNSSSITNTTYTTIPPPGVRNTSEKDTKVGAEKKTDNVNSNLATIQPQPDLQQNRQKEEISVTTENFNKFTPKPRHFHNQDSSFGQQPTGIMASNYDPQTAYTYDGVINQNYVAPGMRNHTILVQVCEYTKLDDFVKVTSFPNIIYKRGYVNTMDPYFYCNETTYSSMYHESYKIVKEQQHHKQLLQYGNPPKLQITNFSYNSGGQQVMKPSKNIDYFTLPQPTQFYAHYDGKFYDAVYTIYVKCEYTSVLDSDISADERKMIKMLTDMAKTPMDSFVVLSRLTYAYYKFRFRITKMTRKQREREPFQPLRLFHEVDRFFDDDDD
ncbi:hypothetical protein M569_11954 [Genlisea aurea]|uniref:Uncharacterized protein n=1 Tax=Genlisea aurea TaxID=192259 RepID=S8DJ37_9LAMI|nr:hypothetical protein M569_11954 [Genlisea aurea]